MKANPEAFESLLRGQRELRLYTPGSLQRAVGYYQQALSTDPRYALASAELANCYRLLSGSAVLSPAETMRLAEAAAWRALAADPDLAEAHAALADIKKDQWGWAAAEGEYRRAIQLNPNLASARYGFAIYLSVSGRHDEAVAEARRARDLDPLGTPAAIHAAAVYYNARRFAPALAVLRDTAKLDPGSSSVWTWIGIVNGGTGQFSNAIEAYEKAVGLGDDTPATQCYYGYSLARSGRRDEAARILQRLQRSSIFVPPTGLAILYLGLDQKERAIESLQRAYSARDPLLQYLRVEAHFNGMADDQRFKDIAARMKLTQ
jgi:serine/threonine-protein kinase